MKPEPEFRPGCWQPSVSGCTEPKRAGTRGTSESTGLPLKGAQKGRAPFKGAPKGLI